MEPGPRAVQRWNVADLEARLCRILDLAAGVLDRFGVNGFTDQESPVYNCGPEKVVAETAMLAYAASGASSYPQIRERLDTLVRLLVPLARGERALLAMALQPALATKFALPHVLLTWMGHVDADCDEFVRACLRSAVRNGHDRSPTAAVEYAWLCSRWSRPELANGRRVRPTRPLLNWPLDVFEGLRDDVYAFTHLVMYGTDFGYRARGLGHGTLHVLAMSEAMVARYLDAEDYDLTGEILLAWPMTSARWSPVAAFGFRVLARVEDDVGLLPCGNVDTNRLQRLSGEARTTYALGMAYHTAYVMGFLCATALRSGRTPPTGISGPTFEPVVLDQLRKYLDDSQGHWQADFASLSRAEQLILTPLVLAVALVQKCRRRNYDAALDLLRLADKHGLADTLVCHQASQLLERIARCSTVLHAKRRMTRWELPEPPSGFRDEGRLRNGTTRSAP